MIAAALRIATAAALVLFGAACTAPLPTSDVKPRDEARDPKAAPAGYARDALGPTAPAVDDLRRSVKALVPTAPPAWERRLRGDAIVLLGEVHDNPSGHRLRLETLQRAFAAGWRPAIAMEQFDRGQQAAIERARRERPGDAQHLIDSALADGPARSGWDWAFYKPLVELALRHDVPLIAANLSNADTGAIVRGGYAAVFDAAAVAALGLDRTVPADLQAAQDGAIDGGHCHALPSALWPAMARAQFARDALMAQVLRLHAARGVVLLAGNGHVRRDLGVPRWIDVAPARLFAVGYLEAGEPTSEAAAGNATGEVAEFDAIVRTAPVERADPCAAFRKGPVR